MRVTVKDRKIPGMMYTTVMPDYRAHIDRVLRDIVYVNEPSLQGNVTVENRGGGEFFLSTPDLNGRIGGRSAASVASNFHPQYDKLVSAINSIVEGDKSVQEGLVLTFSPLTDGIGRPHPREISPPTQGIENRDDKGIADKPTIPFEEGKDLEITLSDEAMQSSDVKSTLAKGGSIGDLVVYDLIDEGISQYRAAESSYSKNADKLAARGIGIKAFYHPLMVVMKDPLKVTIEREALLKGMIVEGNRILIPSALITPTLRPFLDKLLIPKPSYTVRFVTPESEPIKVVTSEFKTAESAESSNRNYYILGGAILLTAGLTAFFMRRR
jgi:hypothetical protein